MTRHWETGPLLQPKGYDPAGKRQLFASLPRSSCDAAHPRNFREGTSMDGLIYLIGLIVVILAILSFFGLR